MKLTSIVLFFMLSDPVFVRGRCALVVVLYMYGVSGRSNIEYFEAAPASF